MVCDGAPDGRYFIFMFFKFFVVVPPDDILLLIMCLCLVTGLHDMDEFVQSQLILAVSAVFFYRDFNFSRWC